MSFRAGGRFAVCLIRFPSNCCQRSPSVCRLVSGCAQMVASILAHHCRLTPRVEHRCVFELHLRCRPRRWGPRHRGCWLALSHPSSRCQYNVPKTRKLGFDMQLSGASMHGFVSRCHRACDQHAPSQSMSTPRPSQLPHRRALTPLAMACTHTELCDQGVVAHRTP